MSPLPVTNVPPAASNVPPGCDLRADILSPVTSTLYVLTPCGPVPKSVIMSLASSKSRKTRRTCRSERRAFLPSAGREGQQIPLSLAKSAIASKTKSEPPSTGAFSQTADMIRMLIRSSFLERNNPTSVLLGNKTRVGLFAFPVVAGRYSTSCSPYRYSNTGVN